MNDTTISIPNKRFKLFLVEEGDDDRERVISGTVDVAEIKYENDFDRVEVDMLLDSARIFQTQQRASMTLLCVPGADGVLFRMENFLEADAGLELDEEDEDE